MKTEVMTRLFNENGEQVITSLDIAKLTGKEHRNVLRDIKNMEPAWEQLHQLKFEQMQIKEKLPNNGYRMRKVYVLTKLESLYIATKYNDQARARLILRWAELESKNLTPALSQGEGVKMLETERDIMQRSDEIRRQQIETENAPADGCFTVSEIAKQLGVTPKDINRMLVKEGVQYFNGGRYKLTPEFEGKGYAKERSFHYYGLEGDKKERIYLVWTPEGVEYVTYLYYLTN
jgi:phage regulator Rha-like protein